MNFTGLNTKSLTNSHFCKVSNSKLFRFMIHHLVLFIIFILKVLAITERKLFLIY